MKKLTALLVTCLLTSSVIAQESEDKPDPKNKKGKGSAQKSAPGAPKGAAPAKAKAQQPPAASKQEKRAARKPAEAPAAPVARNKPPRERAPAPVAEKSADKPVNRKKNPAKVQQAASQPVDAPKKPAVVDKAAVTNAKKRSQAEREILNKETAKAEKSGKNGKNSPARRAQAEAAANRQERVRSANARKLEPQKITEIRTRNRDFRAQPRPDRVPTVTYLENRRIENSDRWQGSQYDAFRRYRSERHDREYYHSRYNRVELIGGGYYYQSNNYWYPAWGYQPSAEYYAYDGPIYVGERADPPDRVIADVQAALQDMGYYRGEVDGLLGPLTREALTGYQTDQGLEPTAAIDEPTLDELDLG